EHDREGTAMPLRSGRALSRAPCLLAAVIRLGLTPAVAHGVPIRDVAALGRLTALLEHLAAAAALQAEKSATRRVPARIRTDATLQAEKGATRSEIARVATEQLEALDRITGAMSGPGFAPAPLETDHTIGAAAVYGSSDVPGPMDSRLFGEGRETVEMMIVR